MSTLKERVQERLDLLGLKAAPAAREAGLKPDYIRDILRDRKTTIEGRNARALAEVLQCTVEWLVSGEGIAPDVNLNASHISHKSSLTRRQRLVVIGEVRAGAWLETPLESTANPREVLPLDRDPLFDRAGQYALRVTGTSMNKLAQLGDYIIVAEWADTGYDLKSGMVVVVHRERGGLTETTVKRVREGQKGWELWPESTDPAHQDRIDLEHGENDVEVRVIGLVIGYYRRQPQP